MRKYLFYLALLLVGCGGNGDGFSTIEPEPLPAEGASPEISNLTVSPDIVLFMQGDGNVTATAEFSYADADLDIATMQVEMSDGNNQSIPLDTIDTASGTLSEEFAVSTEAAGALTVEVWLVDAVGNASNRLSDEILVQNPVPVISGLAPNEIESGESGFDLSVTGTGFLDGATVIWDGANRTTRYVDNTQVVATIQASDLETPRSVGVRVRNPEPTAGASNELSFVVSESDGGGSGGSEPSDLPILITETIDGSVPNGPSVNGGLDPWGTYAVFASKASNLITDDNNDAYDLFVRDTCQSYADECTPTTTRAVMGVGGAEPNGDIGWTETSPSNSLGVNFTARYAAFVSSASNLVPDDTNGVDDVFVVDTCLAVHWMPDPGSCTPKLIRVSLANNGSQSTMPASYPALGMDGRYVVFVSSDPNLVAGDTNGVADVFLRDTCLGAISGCTPSTKRISVANDGAEANGASGEPSFTGRYVAFSSLASNLVAADSNGVQDVFLRDTCLGESQCVPSTRLVSIGFRDDPADGASSDPQVGLPLAEYHGRFVAFVSSATNLVATDTNVASDVFLRDLCSGFEGCSPSTRLISLTSSGEQIQGDSWSPDFLSWDGGTVPFVTAADGVVPGDTNGMADVYVWSEFTRRVSVGAGGAQTDGDSYAPRTSHHPYGVWPVTYISEASNILEDAIDVSNHGNIYMLYWSY